MLGLSANKKILISVAAFLLVVAILAGGLFIMGRRSENGSEDSSNLHTLPQLEYESNSSEDGSEDRTANSTAQKPQPSAASAAEKDSIFLSQKKTIEAFLSGTFYMSSAMITDGESKMMNMAIRGKDFQTTMEAEGMTATIMYINSKIYFVNESAKTYIELSNVLMKTLGLDMSDIEGALSEINFSGYEFTNAKKFDAEVDGQKAECFMYYNAELSVSFYFIGEDLKKIDFGDAQGHVASTMEVYDFSPVIPTGMLTLSGLTEKNLLTFFSDMS